MPSDPLIFKKWGMYTQINIYPSQTSVLKSFDLGEMDTWKSKAQTCICLSVFRMGS